MCGAWEGAIVAAVYVESDSYADCAAKARAIEDDFFDGKIPEHLTIVLAYRDANDRFGHEKKCPIRHCRCAYPINALRNVATRHALAEFVLHVDVDMLPSRGLCRRLSESSSCLHRDKTSNSIAWIVPAFELHHASARLPRTRRALEAMWIAGYARGFQMFRYAPGHRATDHARWLRNMRGESYDVAYEHGFEPYVVVARESFPSFDERFAGYGKNKTAHSILLRHRGFRFRVLPHGFVVSRTHARSRQWFRAYHPIASKASTSSRIRRAVVDAVFREIVDTEARFDASRTKAYEGERGASLTALTSRHLLVVAPSASGKSFAVNAIRQEEAKKSPGCRVAVADADHLVGDLIGWDELSRVADTPYKNRRMWEEILSWLARQTRPTAVFSPPYGGVRNIRSFRGFDSSSLLAVAVVPSETRHKANLKRRATDIREGRLEKGSKPEAWTKIARHRRKLAAECEEKGGIPILRDTDVSTPFRAWRACIAASC